MAAIENLEAAVEGLKVEVAKVVDVVSNGDPAKEARIQAAANAVAAESAKLDAVNG